MGQAKRRGPREERVAQSLERMKLDKKEKPEAINARLFDLCRYQRSELLEAELITYEEYMFLMHDCPLAQGGGSPSPRRLEDYDRIRARLKEAEALTTELRAVIRKTIMENLHLADGDVCTLKLLKDSIGFDLDSPENASVEARQ